MFNEGTPVTAVWRIIEKDLKGNIIADRGGENLVVNTGKEMLLTLLFAMAGSSTSAAITCAAGACSTPATLSDLRLPYEHIANSSRKGITNTSGTTLAPGNIESGSFVVNTITYTRRVIAQAIWDGSDSNLNQPFRDYALMSALLCPGTPTGTSGIMFNHYVDTQNIIKTAGNSITIQISVYF